MFGTRIQNRINRFRIPPSFRLRQPNIRICGMQEVGIDAHQGLLEYSESRVLVQTSGRVLAITGSELLLCSMSARELLIRGDIRCVEILEI